MQHEFDHLNGIMYVDHVHHAEDIVDDARMNEILESGEGNDDICMTGDIRFG